VSEYPISERYGSKLVPREPEQRPPEPPASIPMQEDETPASSSQRRRPAAATSSRDEFTAPPAPLQVKLPQDLIQSLKLHSIATGKTMSDLVLECLTSDQQISKAWISTRRAGWSFALAWKEHETAAAKERQGTRTDIVETFPQCSTGKAR